MSAPEFGGEPPTPGGVGLVGAGSTVQQPSTAAIARLATLHPVEYDRVRAAEAERPGCRLSTLDALVHAARRASSAAMPADVGGGLLLPEVEPWPEPVELPALLDALVVAVCRHVVLPSAAAVAVALWAAHTHIYERFPYTPRLVVRSPAPRCGKSTLIEVLRRTCRRPLKADNIRASGVYRAVGERAVERADAGDRSGREGGERRGGPRAVALHQAPRDPARLEAAVEDPAQLAVGRQERLRR